MDGALLLEMYTDSGNGTMVSHDFHEAWPPHLYPASIPMRLAEHFAIAAGAGVPSSDSTLSPQTIIYWLTSALVPGHASGKYGRCWSIAGADAAI